MGQVCCTPTEKQNRVTELKDSGLGDPGTMVEDKGRKGKKAKGDGKKGKKGDQYQASSMCGWEHLPNKGTFPKPRRAHTMIAISPSAMFVFGGVSSRKDAPYRGGGPSEGRAPGDNLNGVLSNGCYLFAAREQHWDTIRHSGDVPSPRCTHSCVVHKGGVFLLGSHDKMCSSLFFFSFSNAEWKIMSDWGTRPGALSGHSAVVAGDLMLVFGGETPTMLTNNLYMYCFASQRWNIIESTRVDDYHPGARRDHSAVVYGDRMLVFGGFSALSSELDFVEFNATQRKWKEVVCMGTFKPRCRGGHSVTMWQHLMFVVGGLRNNTEYLNDILAFNAVTDTWTQVQQSTLGSSLPRPSCLGSIAVMGSYMYHFGGGDAERNYSELHRINLATLSSVVDPAHTIAFPSNPNAWKDLEGYYMQARRNEITSPSPLDTPNPPTPQAEMEDNPSPSLARPTMQMGSSNNLSAGSPSHRTAGKRSRIM